MHTEDGSIISKCLDGEPEAFGILVDKYKSGIYAFVYAKLGNFRDAQEITQDVFVEAFCKLHTLRRWESLAFWLYRIASNLCGKRLRDRVRHPEHEFIEDQAPGTLETSFIHSYQQEQMSQTIREAMDSLPEIYREVLILYYFGGMTSKDIAKALGTSPTAILQRLTRARAQLKEDLVTMIGASFESKRLGSSFTFRIVEAVKRINPNPVSVTKGVPWGISLATGIIMAFLSIGIHLPLDKSDSTGFLLPGESKVLNVGEYPVDVMKASNISVMSNGQMNGDGFGSVVPSLQNALFMAPQAGDTWTKKADMPTARSESSASVVNGKIYVIGGWNWNKGGNLATAEEYDPVTDIWTKKADMPNARSQLSASVVNGKVYVIGGIDSNNNALSTVDEYDPATDIWTKKADMPTARSWLSTSSINGKIYAIGGIWGDHLSTVEEYNPVTNSWKRKADLPRRIHTLSTGVVNGKIYTIGGVDNGVVLSTVYEYDPAKDSWTKKSSMLAPRWELCASTVNGSIYAIGGLSGLDWNTFLSTVEEYDPDADKWTKKTDMPTSRYSSVSGAVAGKIYIIGGENNSKLSTVEEYDTGFSGESINFKGKLPTTWGDAKLAQSK
jgi:RNA polymerase sigma factor (sigma-70 family)